MFLSKIFVVCATGKSCMMILLSYVMEITAYGANSELTARNNQYYIVIMMPRSNAVECRHVACMLNSQALAAPHPLNGPMHGDIRRAGTVLRQSRRNTADRSAKAARVEDARLRSISKQ